MKTCFYLFLATKPFSHKGFAESLGSFDLPFHISYESELRGSIECPPRLGMLLSNTLFTIHDDLDTTLVLLEAPKKSLLSEKLLEQALSYFPNQVVCLSDILLKEFSFGNFSSIPLLKNEFKEVPHELMLTAGAYLRTNLNACLTAETLYIHRNTFNYRLNAFIEKTGLDIRE
ncbi:MAG TPA: hypothetical protein DCZ41_01020, partial [Firmicutes bacterium]|nr:hypothetical protein [Bacillota bacterium]